MQLVIGEDKKFKLFGVTFSFKVKSFVQLLHLTTDWNTLPDAIRNSSNIFNF